MRSVPFGYHGRYLRVDLTTGESGAVRLPAEVLRKFIGGSGLGAWILLQESTAGLDPLSADAPLIFVFSPLVGSPLTTSAKFAVVSKSPLTNRINDSLSSSHFAIAGKKTGYDAIVIVGRAERPCCLFVDDAGVRFEEAADVWGQTVRRAAETLKLQGGNGYRFAVIGPAGENLVRFATISHDGRHAGRGGSGAVMGSKNLKAVAVRGSRTVKFADPVKLNAFAKQLARQSMGPATAKYRELGTVGNLLTFNRLGTLPTRNFQQATFEQAEAISAETFSSSRKRTRESCAACNIGCEHIFELEQPPPSPPIEQVLPTEQISATEQVSPTGQSGEARSVRLEYESLFALGSLCGVSDPEIVLRASALCDELGMDTISAGATIAFAMECAERKLIDIPQLRFGNGEAMLRQLAEIGARSGWGKLLSQGTRAMARVVGQGAEEFAPHVKGLEIPGYEPRAMQTMALGFAVGTRGADHNRSGAYQVDFSEQTDRLHPGNEAVVAAVNTENEAAMMDSLILCKFLRGIFDDRFAAMAEMLRLTTGTDYTAAELQETAERIVTLRKWYNIREGWRPAEDTLPARFFRQALPDGVTRGAVLSESRLREMIHLYNLARGWTKEGDVPKSFQGELPAPPPDSVPPPVSVPLSVSDSVSDPVTLSDSVSDPDSVPLPLAH